MDETKAFIRDGENGVFFVITSKTGKDVSKYSSHKEEAEVLFRPGTTFMIKSVERCDHGGIRVTMEELAV